MGGAVVDVGSIGKGNGASDDHGSEVCKEVAGYCNDVVCTACNYCCFLLLVVGAEEYAEGGGELGIVCIALQTVKSVVTCGIVIGCHKVGENNVECLVTVFLKLGEITGGTGIVLVKRFYPLAYLGAAFKLVIGLVEDFKKLGRVKGFIVEKLNFIAYENYLTYELAVNGFNVLLGEGFQGFDYCVVYGHSVTCHRGGIIKVKADETLFDASASVDDWEKNLRKKRLHFGMVFQSFNLFPQYTALENVTLAEKLLAQERPDYKQHKKEILEEIEQHGKELLDQMGLSQRQNHYPHQLSGGQQQRVAIARALALKPDILCFDEPTSALDPELTGEVLKVIRGLADQKTTMIIVTHEMAFARDVADQIIFMDNGVIVEQGDPHQVIDHPKEERTRQFLARYSQENL